MTSENVIAFEGLMKELKWYQLKLLETEKVGFKHVIMIYIGE